VVSLFGPSTAPDLSEPRGAAHLGDDHASHLDEVRLGDIDDVLTCEGSKVFADVRALTQMVHEGLCALLCLLDGIGDDSGEQRVFAAYCRYPSTCCGGLACDSSGS
jgi:hypothetical protein